MHTLEEPIQVDGHKDNKNASGLGSYHYHCNGNPPHLHTNGCPYSTSSSSDSTSSIKSTTPVKKLGSDTTLSSLKIDGQELTLTDIMNFKTYNQKIMVKAVATDSKSKVSVSDTNNLIIGENKIIITVTAEDNSVKDYEIIVNREKKTSSNTNIKVTINDTDVIFNNYESDKIYVSSSTQDLNIKYILEDVNSKVDIINDKNIEEGENQVIIAVIAENGEKQDYIVNIHKNKESEETTGATISLVALGGIGLGAYAIIKNRKSKTSNN